MLAVGDWGGVNDRCPTTAAQIMVADGMARAAERLGAEFVLLLGDNFYEAGVSEDGSPPRFNDTFAEVYSAPPLLQLPFYVVAGNHDHMGSVRAQMDFARLDSRWRFPALNHSIVRSWSTASGQLRSVEFLLVDTVVLAGNSDGPWGHRSGLQLEGPMDKKAAEQMWEWLEERLNASTADFLWVGGHYPIYSAGNDGSTPLLAKRLLPLLAAHKAHYVSGHDHMLEHILVEGVHLIVTGMGRECCYPDTHRWTVPRGSLQYMLSGRLGGGAHVGVAAPGEVQGGFASFNITDEAATVTFHSESGAEIYTSPAIPRRGAARARLETAVVV